MGHEVIMKPRALMILSFCATFFSCNLPEWNQDRLNNKLHRNQISEHFFKTEKSTLHYYAGGSGPPVLLLHGFGGDAQITWHKTMSELVKANTVIAPDLLWFGKSQSTLPPNIQSQAAEIISLIDYLKVDTFYLAGISYGGFVSLEIFLEIGLRVEKLCLIDSPGITYEVTNLDSLAKETDVSNFTEIFVTENPQAVQRLMDLAFYRDKKIPKSILKKTYDLYFDQNHYELEKLLTSLVSYQKKFGKEKHLIYPPTLIIWGREDDVFPLSEGKKLADHMNAEFYIIDKAGHAPNIEQFDSFIYAFKNFMIN